MVDIENTEFTNAPAPIVKKWCTHTTKLRPAMMTIAPTMVLYPKICFWANEAMTSEKIPNAGSMTIYTSGCPHIQNRFAHIIGSPSPRSEEHTSELQSRFDLVCRLLLEKKK